MNCSVCNRNNADTLSICPNCGAMKNDSVRKELDGKISAAVKPIVLEMKPNIMPNNNLKPIKTTVQQTSIEEPKTNTSELPIKQTSPTLVEFHNKNAALPEWRLQLQNAVRQRQERETQETEMETSAQPAPRAKLVTSGANALKAEVIEQPQPIVHSNPNLANALRRIENSRQRFLVAEETPTTPKSSVTKATKNYPFYIAGKTTEANQNPAKVNTPIYSFAKPKLAPQPKIEKKDLDTNKLPPIPKPAQQPSTIVETRVEVTETTASKIIETEKIEILETVVAEEIEIEEYDDCAPFAMRFNAGLFDLIIGSFTSLILLAPFMLLGGSWLSVGGIFAFLATCSIVMFIYMTTTLGLYGKTFGMRLFSLEVIDIQDEGYPTFHQSAVSSAVYLLSLALGGIGFLTLFFNEDKRAAHDLISGTIIVREELNS